MGEDWMKPNRYQFRKGIVVILITQRCGRIRRCIIDTNDYEMCSKYHWSVLDNRKENNLTYAYTRKNNKTIGIHHLVYGKEADGVHIDHINHDGLDNRKKNLRIATVSQNAYNQRPQTRKKSSKYKGVRFNKHFQLWEARIKKDRIYYVLGFFSTSWEAAQAYNEAAIEMFGEFAFPNIINEEDKMREPVLTNEDWLFVDGNKTSVDNLTMADWGVEDVNDFLNPSFDLSHLGKSKPPSYN